MKIKSCCFSGHRNLNFLERKKIKEKLKSEIEKMILEKEIIYFYSGGAIGFDTIASLCVIKLRKKYNYIKLMLILPCYEQDKFWVKKDKIIYKYIKNQADKILYVQKKYNNKVMLKRNRYLVNSSSFLLCYLKKEKGGTFYTKNYAKTNDLNIINIFDIIQ